MDFRRHVVRRWRVVAALAAVAVLGAALALAGQADEHERTVHFVLRPDASVSNDDLPGALDALESDGPLVQSVIGVVGGDEMLRRAATDAGVPYRADFEIESTGRPGSALIDSTLTASSEEVLDPLAAAYARAASNYVGSSYSAYVLARLSIESGGNGTGPSTLQILIIAALAGALLGAALVAAELGLRRGVQAPAAEVPHARRPWAPATGDGRPPAPPRPRVVESLDVRPPEPRDVRPSAPLDGRPRAALDGRPRNRSTDARRNRSPSRSRSRSRSPLRSRSPRPIPPRARPPPASRSPHRAQSPLPGRSPPHGRRPPRSRRPRLSRNAPRGRDAQRGRRPLPSRGEGRGSEGGGRRRRSRRPRQRRRRSPRPSSEGEQPRPRQRRWRSRRPRREGREPKAAEEPKAEAAKVEEPRPRQRRWRSPRPRHRSRRSRSRASGGGTDPEDRRRSRRLEGGSRPRSKMAASGPNGAPDSKPASESTRKPATPAKAVPDEHEG